MTVVLAIVFGILIGALLGLVGGGGSILTVPVLVYILDIGVHQATTTSLVIVGATALFGAVPHFRAGRVDLKTAAIFGGTGIAGAFIGTALNRQVSGPMILMLFGVLMLIVAARMAIGRNQANHKPTVTSRSGSRWPELAAGLVVGIMTGFFGVGGGFLIVPALVILLRFPMRRAVGTSLVIIAIISSAGVIAHLGSGGVDLSLAAIFIGGGFAGSMLGSLAGGRVNETALSRGFAGLVVLVGFYLIIRNAMLLA